MTMQTQIHERLEIALKPTRLDVVNDSHKHAGHHGSPGTGASHFTVTVVSSAFEGLSRVARHRLINEALAVQLAAGVHALAIRALTPGEDVVL